MGQEEELMNFSFLQDKEILVGSISYTHLGKENALEIYEYTREEAPKQPDYKGFVLDVSSVLKVDDSALGYLMKSLELVKKVKGYMVLVLSEELLQDVMVRHPILFDYYAVFHTIDEAITYIERNL